MKRLTTETGAGQWGSALSLASCIYGLECKVYMVRASYEQKPYRRVMIETWGGQVVPSPIDQPDHPGSLGAAISDAVRDAAAGREDSHYSLGSVLNHVLLHQTVIGLEAIEQMAMAGEGAPQLVVGSCGGGSNLGGLALPFVPNPEVEPPCRRAGLVPHLDRGPLRLRLWRRGGDDTAARDVHTRPRVCSPSDPRQRGLRYHGDAPIISNLVRHGRMQATAYPQGKVFEAALQFASAPRAPFRHPRRATPSARSSTPPSRTRSWGENGSPVQLLGARAARSLRLRGLPRRPPGVVPRDATPDPEWLSPRDVDVLRGLA